MEKLGIDFLYQDQKTVLRLDGWGVQGVPGNIVAHYRATVALLSPYEGFWGLVPQNDVW